MFDHIPEELRLLRQWVLHDASKRPYQINGEYADVTSPVTWNSFDAVRDCLSMGSHFTGLGFVLTESDPYSILDLDHTENQEWVARQLKIAQAFGSYSEVSLSGKGLHIIVKGKVQSGARRDKIEIYSSGRYMAMTGNVYNDKPIEDRQELLIQLWNEIKKPNDVPTNGVNEDEQYSDIQICAMAAKAENGTKFTQLLSGEWQSLYPSQSEADYAFIDIIAFYTKNRSQITRIFHSSNLGKRPKAKRNDYLNGMINKSFDRIVTPIDIEGFKEAIKQKLASVAQLVEPVPHKNFDLGSNPGTSTNTAGSSNGKTTDFESVNEVSTTSPATIPPGLIGELATYIYNSAPHPVWEIALAGAIAFMAGICGKTYNCNGNTINLYLLIVGDTGIGKEAPRTAISKLVNEIDKKLITPIAKSFFGPQRIASGQALNNYIKDNPSFVSFLGEFGLRMQSICDPNASSSERGLYDTLLDLFSVGTGMLGENIYADKTRSSAAVQGHAMTILGDTTPGTFYSMIDENMISTGLLPRFLIFEYKGKRSYFNRNKVDMPTQELITKVGDLISSVKTKIHERMVIDVKINDDAREALLKISDDATDKINDASKDMYKALWNRAHLKVQRLASLVAIGINPHFPTMDYNCVDWAAHIVYHDIEVLLSKFETGDTGNNIEIKQQQELMKSMYQFVMKSWNEMIKYECGTEKMHDDKIVPYKFINKRLANFASFRNDKVGATNAMKRTIQTLIDSGRIIEISKVDMIKRYNTSQKAYIISD